MKKALIATVTVAAVAGGIFYFVTQGGSQAGKGLSLENRSALNKSELTQIVSQQQGAYEANGFEMSKSGDNFSLVVKDDKKVRKFLMERIAKMLPKSYKKFTDEMTKTVMAGDKSVLEGMTFDMDIIDAKGAKLKVTLKKLPDMIDQELAQNPATEKRVYDFIAKGGLSYELTLDKKGEVNGFKLTDIDETIKPENGNEQLKFAIKGFEAVFKGSLQAEFDSISKLDLVQVAFTKDPAQEFGSSFDIAFKGIQGNSHQTTPFDEVTHSVMKQTDFHLDSARMKMDAKVDDMTMDTVSALKAGFLNGSFDVTIPSITVKAEKYKELVDIALKGLQINIEAEHISKKAIDAMSNVGMGTNPQQDMKQTLSAYDEMIKSGLTVQLKALNFKMLDLKLPNGMALALHDFSFALKVDLKENSLDMRAGNPAQYLPFIQAHARIAINDEDLNTITQMAPMAGMVLGLKKVEGDLAVYEIDFENGNLTLNGSPLPFGK